LAVEAPPAERQGLVYRFENRLRLAHGLDPQGPLKRWDYRRRLDRCVHRFEQAVGRTAARHADSY